MVGTLQNMLSPEPTQRPAAALIAKNKHFDNVLLNSIKYLENLCEKNQLHKAQFLKGLTKVLPQFPERVLVKKVMVIHPFILFIYKSRRCVP